MITDYRSLIQKNQQKEVIGSSKYNIMINQEIGAELPKNLKKGGKNVKGKISHIQVHASWRKGFHPD